MAPRLERNRYGWDDLSMSSVLGNPFSRVLILRRSAKLYDICENLRYISLSSLDVVINFQQQTDSLGSELHSTCRDEQGLHDVFIQDVRDQTLQNRL